MGISILQPDPDLCLYPDHGEYPNLDTVLDFDPKVREQELESIALWVKSGNRGNLKCLKVNNHFVLIFHRKIFVSFLSDAKMPKVYD